MKYSTVIFAACVGALVSASVAAAENTNVFPEVPLSAGSVPHYAVLSVDPFTNRVVYVMFDGNVKDGYGRMYVWAPGDPKYARPVPLTASAANKFPAVAFASVSPNGQDVASIGWNLGWDRRTGPGTYQRFDYVSGKNVTVAGGSGTYPIFPFETDYQFSDRGKVDQAAGVYPLDIRIHWEMPTSEVWTNLPPVFAPWERLNFYMKAEPFYNEKSKGFHFVGKINYYDIECSVRSVPKSTEILLTVAPYLEPPLYSTNVSPAVAFSEGVKVEVNPGWYDLTWKFTCPGLVVPPRLDFAVRLWPQPFYPPAARGK